jgi:uncharacterized protein YkwD
LTISVKLNRSSYGYSFDMGTRNYWNQGSSGHDTKAPYPDWLGGPSFTDRIRHQGYSYTAAAENIAAGYGTAEQVFNGWKNSPGHNANMLNPKYTQIGIGRATVSGSTYGTYWTTDFGNGNDGSGC